MFSDRTSPPCQRFIYNAQRPWSVHDFSCANIPDRRRSYPRGFLSLIVMNSKIPRTMEKKSRPPSYFPTVGTHNGRSHLARVIGHEHGLGRSARRRRRLHKTKDRTCSHSCVRFSRRRGVRASCIGRRRLGDDTNSRSPGPRTMKPTALMCTKCPPNETITLGLWGCFYLTLLWQSQNLSGWTGTVF